jgi:hypothetical protein
VTAVVRREDLARAVADAVTAVPGVARLSPGAGIEVATMFAGGKVVGLRLAGEVVAVHIVADRTPLPAIADGAAQAARRVLSAVGDDREVRVVVEDADVVTVDRRQAGRD